MELLKMLERFKYKNIVIIDDENYFNPTVKECIGESSEISNKMVEQFGKEVLDKRLNDCTNNILELIEDYVRIYQDSNPYNVFTEEIRKNVNFMYCLSMNEYNNKLSEENTLWFIDIEIGNNSSNSDFKYNHIKELYKFFYERIKKENKNDIFILFSNSAEKYDTLDKLKNFLIEEVKVSLSDDSCVELNTNIIKKSIIDSSLIYQLILKASKNKYFDVLMDSIKTSLNKLKENFFDFKKNLNLFHYDYLTEGKSLDESLFDIFLCDLKNTYLGNLDYSIFSTMNKAIDYYLENSNSIEEEKILWRIAKTINDFDNPCLIDENVNKLHHDISFGDLFLIGEKYYMIANQPCDLAIRDSGERKNSQSILIPISLEYMDDEKILKYKNSITSSIIKKETKCATSIDISNINDKVKEEYGLTLKNGAENKSYRLIRMSNKVYNLKFNNKEEFLSIPFWCLDDVSCNSDGKVYFSYSMDGLRFSLKKRIEHVKDKCIKMKDKIQDMAKFISLAYLNDECKESAEIKRVGKINSETAMNLYREFISHQSRVAINSIIKLE